MGRGALIVALLAGVLTTIARAEPPVVAGSWPCYSGPSFTFASTPGAKLIDDMTAAKLLWQSEETEIGFTKSDSAYGRSLANFGALNPGGLCSPIVADGLVLLSYFEPTGDVYDTSYKKVIGEANYEQYEHKARVMANDVVIAIDAATGKTRWKNSYEGGRNLGSGKRNLYGVTPAAANGKVYTVGTTGAMRAIELASGKLLWETPPWTELVTKRNAAIAAAKEDKSAFANADGPTGWLTVIDDIVLVPLSTANHTRGGKMRAVEASTGKTLWEAAGHPNNFTFTMIDGRRAMVSVRQAIDLKTGKTLWSDAAKPAVTSPPVMGKELLVSYDTHPKADALLQAKEKSDRKGVQAFGLLTAFAVSNKGLTVKWQLPDTYATWLLPDDGGFLKTVPRDGLLFHVSQAWGEEKQAKLLIIREADGKILAAQNIRGGYPYLWGDRLILVSDMWHRPRAANAELWQMFTIDPNDFKPLGNPWHVNGNPPVHTATGGYEISQIEAFADGLAFSRVAGGIRCYDLRKP